MEPLIKYGNWFGWPTPQSNKFRGDYTEDQGTICPALTWPRECHDNKPLDVSRTSSCPYFPGRMLRVRQNVSDHILAEIQLVRSAHGTTCSPTPSLLLTLTVSQETLSLCNIDRFISSQSLANDLRMRDAAASVGKCQLRQKVVPSISSCRASTIISSCYRSEVHHEEN